MSDRQTKLLWWIAIGVWLNFFAQGYVHPRLIPILDNIDGNLAWANTHLMQIRDKQGKP
ncbi:MAG: hypothetical protein J2P50_00215 [Hyphomicrobiaceae bacterium]|nr:hypothetical protein [Hyphomicrobiaceae bacterium]